MNLEAKESDKRIINSLFRLFWMFLCAVMLSMLGFQWLLILGVLALCCAGLAKQKGHKIPLKLTWNTAAFLVAYLMSLTISHMNSQHEQLQVREEMEFKKNLEVARAFFVKKEIAISYSFF